MRPLQIALTGALVIVAVTGCRPRTPPTARLALDCPTTQGGLTRSSVAPDGKSCLYASRDGDEVSLRLIPVTGTYQAALGTVEQELQALVLTDADIAKAKALLGWEPKVDVRALAGMMVAHDLKLAERELLLRLAGREEHPRGDAR